MIVRCSHNYDFIKMKSHNTFFSLWALLFCFYLFILFTYIFMFLKEVSHQGIYLNKNKVKTEILLL